MGNKKLTVNRLAFGNLRARKKQYTLMIIGIVLAMVFSSGTIFFFACSANSQEELRYRALGRENMILMGSNNVDHEKAIELGYINDYATVDVIGFGYTQNVEKESGVGLGIFDEKAIYFANPILDSGRFPEKKGEIAIEKDALVRLKLNKQVGDKITLTVSVPNGDEGEIKEVKKTYTICGILKDKRSNLQFYSTDTDRYYRYPAAMVSSEETVELGGKAYLLSYLMYNYDNKIDVSFGPFLREQGFNETETSSINSQIRVEDYMIYSQDSYDKITGNTYLTAFLMAVLMIASCFGIVNAFNTNLQERKTQIGMLRAVGMTKRQVINIFGREAFIISIISTPMSVLISYFGVKLYAKIMGESFIFKPEWWVLILSAGVSLICVMAAAFIPLVFATRVTPMQAIRNTELGRKVKNKKIKSKKSFTAPKLLAKRNLVFYRSKQIGIIFILIITVAVPCMGFGLTDDMINTYSDFEKYHDYGFWDEIDYNLIYAYYPEGQKMDENFRNELYLSEHTGSVSGNKKISANLVLDELNDYTEIFHHSLNKETKYTNIESEREMYNKICDLETYMEYGYERSLKENYVKAKEKINCSGEILPLYVSSREGSEVEELKTNLISGKIDVDKLNSGEEIILVAPEEIAFCVEWLDEGERKYLSWDGIYPLVNGKPKAAFIGGDIDIISTASLSYKVGDTVDLCMLVCNDKNVDVSDPFNEKYTYQNYRKQVKIGAIIPSSSVYYPYSSEIGFITTNEGIDTFGFEIKYTDLYLDLNKEYTDEIDEEMSTFIKSLTSGKGIRTGSNYKDIQSGMQEVKLLLIALFSIIILFFCIATSLINNSITAQIRANKREIGTLRAVGASSRELTMSFVYQLLNMFGWGCGLGFAIYSIGYLAFRFFYINIKGYMFTFPYEIWQAALICVLMFAVCSINIYSKVKKQMKNSIVENIREL